MAKKQKALGSILEWDRPAADCTTYVAIGCTPSIKPPDIEDEEIEAICLTDTMDVPESGIDAQSEATFDVFTDPDDPIHKDFYVARDERAEICWRLLPPHKGFDGGTTIDTFEWKGRIRGVQFHELTPDGMYRWTLVIRVTEKITIGTHTFPP